MGPISRRSQVQISFKAAQLFFLGNYKWLTALNACLHVPTLCSEFYIHSMNLHEENLRRSEAT